MFDTVLVANRGEIAVRITRTLRRLGIRSIAIYSEADGGAAHVGLADEARLVGPADARHSYLDIERVVAAAVQAGAQAVHPGYGFLSENADFAEACERAGLVFIGPRSETIRAMGDKRAAKELAAAAGVPVVPGFNGTDATDDRLALEAARIGFPLLVKPAAGGGGKGMRVVRASDELSGALAAARREAMGAFGDDALLLERFVAEARHVEVQVIGDGEGRVLHLGDRDCSLQRRHQKVIEEAPAPFLPDGTRQRMHADAVALATAVRYRGVGTVEFVVEAGDPERYAFLEMNTRLQVEHPVTELVTGLDLVELQLRVAAGRGIGLTQDDVRIEGHAVEARVYAEDGHHGFLPSSGAVLAYAEPANVRVDSGIATGSVIGTSYDPLLLKVVARGADRAAAFDALDAALAGTMVHGVAHNIGVLRALVGDRAVRDGRMTTSLIGDRRLGEEPVSLDDHVVVAAGLAWLTHDRAGEPASAWRAVGAWRVGGQAPVTVGFVDDSGLLHEPRFVGMGRERTVTLGDGEPVLASIAPSAADPIEAVVAVDGVVRAYVVTVDDAAADEVLWIGRGGDSWRLHRPRDGQAAAVAGGAAGGGEIRSPMPGAVIVARRSVGDRVRAGEEILVVEAMKMEYSLAAPVDGVVSSLLVSVGSQVARDEVVAVVDPEAAS